MRAKLLRTSITAFMGNHWAMYFSNVETSGQKRAEQTIDKATFLKALDLLDQKLQEAGKHITFLCVGGATMMLSLGTRQATHDIDGVLRPSDPETTELFHTLAAQVAKELGIEKLWINTQVKDIMAGQTFQTSYFEELPEYHWPNLKLLFAKPGYLLSMKCQAMRVGKRDFSDIVNLLRVLGIRTLEDLESELSKYGNAWQFIGNDEFPYLKLCIAWAFPGKTEYDNVRLRALELRNKK